MYRAWCLGVDMTIKGNKLDCILDPLEVSRAFVLAQLGVTGDSSYKERKYKKYSPGKSSRCTKLGYQVMQPLFRPTVLRIKSLQ